MRILCLEHISMRVSSKLVIVILAIVPETVVETI